MVVSSNVVYYNFDVSVTIGGEISIDISPRGWGKHKILDYIDDELSLFHFEETYFV